MWHRAERHAGREAARNPRRWSASRAATVRAVVIGVVAIAAAHAGETASAARERDAGAAPPADTAAGYRLRCWQRGRLIIDESGLAPAGGIGGGAELLRLVRSPGQGSSTVLVRDGTTCLAQPAARRGELTPYSW